MNKKPRRYHSAVRAAQANETREAILQGVAAWMQRKPHQDFTLAGIAKVAGIERRTVFRHFATKEDLLAAFWERTNHKIAPQTLPLRLTDLLAAPREVFARFDNEEGLIRASLHSNAGREMRLAGVAARRQAFRECLREITQRTASSEFRHLECVAHALYSAAAWETMRDYAGVSGKEAGAAASWALGLLAEAVRKSAAT